MPSIDIRPNGRGYREPCRSGCRQEQSESALVSGAILDPGQLRKQIGEGDVKVVVAPQARQIAAHGVSQRVIGRGGQIDHRVGDGGLQLNQ
jgi:hypothetical protein